MSVGVRLEGVLSVLCTPFDDAGEVDLSSLRRLVEHNLAWGVDGIVCFGLAGEVYKLTDDERRTVLRTVVDAVGGAVPVVAGADHTGVEAAVARARGAKEDGADALMLFPPTFVRPDADGVLDYYVSVGEVGMPFVIQDAPAWTAVPMPVDLLARIAEGTSSLAAVKVEGPPTAPKVRALRERGIPAIGGYGALHLAEELEAGIVAAMPGCAMPGLCLDIVRAHAAGDSDEAWRLHAAALPLLAFQMGSLDVFVSVQKLLLARLGVFGSARLRRPGASISAEQERWLDAVLDRTQLRRYLALAPA
jgi:4-hydroxy-tetrahydrodipicolinate synthase